jgi:hypothetical protein
MARAEEEGHMVDPPNRNRFEGITPAWGYVALAVLVLVIAGWLFRGDDSRHTAKDTSPAVAVVK